MLIFTAIKNHLYILLMLFNISMHGTKTINYKTQKNPKQLI